MRKFQVVAVLLAVVGFAGLAWADCGECDSEQCSSTCSMTKAMEDLPQMVYKVGDETTACACSAKSLAKEHGQEILYVVMEQEYADQSEAMVALADATEQFVNAFAEPHTCSVSGTTTIAGQKMKCSTTAGNLAALVKEAMDEVHMVYKVGEEECSCPNQAAALAEESDEKTTYLVGGESTCCSVDARIKLAHAKYRAALVALAKAEAKTSEAEETTTISTGAES